MAPSALQSTFLAVCLTLGVPAAVYLGLLGAMIAATSLQAHAIYLHKVTLTWFKDQRPQSARVIRVCTPPGHALLHSTQRRRGCTHGTSSPSAPISKTKTPC